MKNLSRWTAVMMCVAVVLGALIGGWAQQQQAKTSGTVFEKFDNALQTAEREPAERERREMTRQWRIIVNDDGEVAGLSDERTMEDYLSERFTDAVNTQVDSYFLCLGSTDRGPGARPDPPRVQDSQNLWFPEMKLPADVDRLTRAYLKATREAGMEVFASFRMNDIHDAWAPKLTYPLKVERPDLLMGEKQSWPEDSVMRAFWSGFDYAKEEVREHFRDFIVSYCRAYDYDGVELDYFRHPLFFKLGEEEENLDNMTEFVRQVRQGLNEIGRERGKPYQLTVRVPDDLNMCLMTGLDVEQWLKEGLLDMLMIGGGYLPYGGRIKELIDLAHHYGVPAYPCINHFVEPIKMRSYASNFWALGADGVYIFNYYGVEDGSEKAECLKQLGDPDILLGLDKEYLPDNGCSIFYCGQSNPPGQFPVRLIDGVPIELVVGDDLQKAAGKGMIEELRLEVKVENVDPNERVAIQINGVQVPDVAVQRVADDTFQAAVQTPPLRRGINHIVVLPGLDSIGRLSSRLTGMSLSVRYK